MSPRQHAAAAEAAMGPPSRGTVGQPEAVRHLEAVSGGDPVARATVERPIGNPTGQRRWRASAPGDRSPEAPALALPSPGAHQRDGARHRVMNPMEFMARLSALAAPNPPWRVAVVPLTLVEAAGA